MHNAASAYQRLVTLAFTLLGLLAPSYVHAALSHRATFPFPDRAQHAAQHDLTTRPSDHHLTSNPQHTRRVGARDVGKAAAARRWVGASPRWGHSMYFYDPAGRLLESRQFRLMETFLHDPASSIVEYVTQANDGDVAAISVFSRPQQKSNGEYGKGGRLLKKREWSYEYDARGRRTAKIRTLGETVERTEYDWDGRDKLRTIRKPDGTRLDYSYDVFGRRVSKSRSGGPLEAKRVEFVWDGEVLAFELDSETGPRAFVHEPGGFEPVLQQQGGETYLCVNDHLGMPKELIDGAGRLAWAAAHSAYGAVIATQGPGELEVEGGFVSGGERQVESPFRLLGQVNDSDAELAWTRFRCFDAEVGTWISTDPLGLRGGYCPYAFEGSPGTHVDPMGLAGSPHPDNRDFKSREEAKAAAYERAGIPPGTEPDAAWEVGGDPKRRGEKGYVYSEDKGAQGRYEQFETEQGSRVVAEHTNDGKPHFHAGQPKGDPSRDAVDFGWGGNRDSSERYQQVDGKHHYYYPESS